MDKLFFVFLCSALGSPRQPLGDQPPDDNKQGTTTIIMFRDPQTTTIAIAISAPQLEICVSLPP